MVGRSINDAPGSSPGALRRHETARKPYATFLAAKAGDFVIITVNNNQLPILKMLLMPVFVFAGQLINEVGAEITHSDLVKLHATRTRVS